MNFILESQFLITPTALLAWLLIKKFDLKNSVSKRYNNITNEENKLKVNFISNYERNSKHIENDFHLVVR